MEMKKIIFAFIVVAALMSSVMATDPKPAAGGAAAGGATAGGAAAGGAAAGGAAAGGGAGAAPAPSTGGAAPAPGPASAAVSDALPAMGPLLGATFVTLFAYYFQ